MLGRVLLLWFNQKVRIVYNARGLEIKVLKNSQIGERRALFLYVTLVIGYGF